VFYCWNYCLSLRFDWVCGVVAVAVAFRLVETVINLFNVAKKDKRK
jgi:hypothetical protein